MVSYFLLTTFNVQLRTEMEPPDEYWLRHRWELFHEYCLPSVENQTAQIFKWNIFIDSESPQWLHNKFMGLGLPFLSLIHVNGVLMNKHFVDSCTRSPEERWIITTRLDNDDALSYDFYEKLSTRVVFEHETAINFQWGVQKTPWGNLLSRQLSNPFISLIEDSSRGSLNTVRGFQHTEIQNIYPTLKVLTHPAWMQVIHEHNLGNLPVGIPIKHDRFAKRFPNLNNHRNWNLFNYFRVVNPHIRLLKRLNYEVGKIRFRMTSFFR